MERSGRDSGFPSTDKWRFYVDSLPAEARDLAESPALINIEVVMRRRVVIPTDLGIEDRQRVDRALAAMGLTEIQEIIDVVKIMSPSQRRFVGADWTDAPGDQFENPAVNELCSVSSKHLTWRIEGDASPKGTMTVVISGGGYERREKVPRQDFERVEAGWKAKKEMYESVVENPASTPDVVDAAIVGGAVAACMYGLGRGIAFRDPFSALAGVYACMEAWDKHQDDLKAAAEAAEKAKRDKTGTVDFQPGEEGFRAGNGFVK